MSRRLRIVIGILAAAIVGVVLWRSARLSEPEYEGKTLSRWLDHHVASSAAEPPYNSPGWVKAEEALRHIGTNGIPTLLKMIRAKDQPAPVLKLWGWAAKKGLIRRRTRYAYRLHEEAKYAFEKLGTNAASAVPELIKIYEANVSASSQRCAAGALGHVGSAAQAAVPVLLRDFSHTNGDVRFYAVSAIYSIGGEPEIIVPALKLALKDPKPQVRWNASGALGNLGRRASSAVPALLEAINDPASQGYEGLKEQLEYVAWHIAPEKIGKILVVEDATPMVAEGMTTQTVDALYDGQRWPLIKLGRRIPCITQFWDSGARGPLTLFRRAGQTNAADHFLGEFEVTGISPPPSNVNISLLCMVADQQILLSARDNNRKEFLEIRRVK